MKQQGIDKENAIARAVRDAKDDDLGQFAQELARTLDVTDGVALVEEALIETSECVGAATSLKRGSWAIMNGLWRWPEERHANGSVLPQVYTVAHAPCEDTDGRRLAPEPVDWIGPEEKLLVEAALMSSKAACDAWFACFLLMGDGYSRRGATRCLTPDGWVVVTWKEDVKSCLMFLDRAYPDSPVIRSIIDEDGSSLIKLDRGMKMLC